MTVSRIGDAFDIDQTPINYTVRPQTDLIGDRIVHSWQERDPFSAKPSFSHITVWGDDGVEDVSPRRITDLAPEAAAISYTENVFHVAASAGGGFTVYYSKFIPGYFDAETSTFFPVVEQNFSRTFSAGGVAGAEHMTTPAYYTHELSAATTLDGGNVAVLRLHSFMAELYLDILDPAGDRISATKLTATISPGGAGSRTDGLEVVQVGDKILALHKDFDGQEVFGQFFDLAGVSLGAEFQISEGDHTKGSFAAVFSRGVIAAIELPDGKYVIAWSDKKDGSADADGSGVWYKIFNANGSVALGETLAVPSMTAGSQIAPELHVLDAGGFVLTFETLGGPIDESGVYLQQYDGNGAKTGGLEFFGKGTSAVGHGILPNGFGYLVGATGDTQKIQIGEGGPGVEAPTAGDDILSGTPNDDTIDGLGGNDFISGLAGFDSLFGGDGNDTLDGGANPGDQGDIMLGGLGNDVYHVDSALDLPDEGIVFGDAADGVDEIISTADFFWDFYSAGDVIRVAENASDPEGNGTTIVGSVFSNFVVGNSKTNVLFGRGGSDTYIAGDGIDFISLSTLGLTDGNAYAGVDGVNTVIVDQRTSGPNSYDIVFEFESGKDKVDLSDYGFASTAAAFATGVDDGAGNAYFVLGDGLDYLYMVGLELAELSASDFVIA